MTSHPTVYTSDECNKCTRTKGEFERRGVAITEINVKETPGAVPALKAMGFGELPVAVTDDDRWSGHRLDKILMYIRHRTRDGV